MRLDNITLLKSVAFNIGTLRAAKKRFSDRLAPEFSIFDYTRSDEMALSNCLAGLLDPQGKHGQGSLFLREFFKCICPDTTWIRNYERCEVNTEKQANAQRRIDVHLGFEEGVVGIENKPWAGDQNSQLSDYATYLEQSATGNRWLLLYMCNDQPSEKSISQTTRENLEKNGNYISFNYYQLVEWLEVCQAKTKALNVRIFIEELVKFVRININGELEMSEENETCKTILASNENLGAAFDIYRAMNGVKRDLLKKFRADLKKELEVHKFHLVWDDSMEQNWKTSSGFGVKFHDNQDLYLRFEFEGAGLYRLFWGVRRESESTKDDGKRWGLIADRMTSQYGKGGGESEWWPWYSTSTRELFNKQVRDWGKESRPWEMMMEQGVDSLARKIADVACSFHNAFSEEEFLLIDSSQG